MWHVCQHAASNETITVGNDIRVDSGSKCPWRLPLLPKHATLSSFSTHTHTETWTNTTPWMNVCQHWMAKTTAYISQQTLRCLHFVSVYEYVSVVGNMTGGGVAVWHCGSVANVCVDNVLSFSGLPLQMGHISNVTSCSYGGGGKSQQKEVRARGKLRRRKIGARNWLGNMGKRLWLWLVGIRPSTYIYGMCQMCQQQFGNIQLQVVRIASFRVLSTNSTN